MIQDWVLSNLNIDYESSAANSYLVAREKSDIVFKDYQIEMIANNSIPGILKMDIRQKNDIIGLYYNITSKITLSQFMLRKKLNKDEFIGILSDILKTLIGSRRYLLNENCFVLNEDYIYLNPSTKEVFLMYIPAEVTYDTVTNLKSFIVRILVEKANFDEASNDNFLQKILSFVRSEDFTISELCSMLELLKGISVKADSNINKQAGKKEISHLVNKNRSEKEISDKKNVIKTQIPEHKLNNSIPTNIKDNRPKSNSGSITGADRNKTEQIKGKSNPVVIAVLVQILAVLGFFIGKNYLISVTGDTVSAYLGTGIVIFALDTLILRKTFDKKQDESDVTNISKRAIISDVKPPVLDGRILESKKNSEDFSLSIKDINESTESINAVEGDSKLCDAESFSDFIDWQDGMDETTVLCTKEPSSPYLSFSHDGIEERIMITKCSFIIGRLQGQVDYVTHNNAVGKVHAEIITRNNSYFVKDLNSRNGSYVNGEQVVPSKEMQIRSGDKITFADSDFTFVSSVN